MYGGGHVGLMGAVADAVLAGGGEVIGVITDQLVGAEIAHRRPDLARGRRLDARAQGAHGRPGDGFIALPGGFGTLDETLEILTWNQLGLIAKPVVFLDVDGYFTSLFEFFDRAVDDRLHP